MSLLEKFKEALSALMGDYSKGKFLLAVSGGKDSMVLMHLCHEAKLQAEVAHVNYGFRPGECDSEEELVRRQSEAFNFPFHVKYFGGKQAIKGNLQAEARDFRYAFFDELLKERNLDFVLTAHHCKDQAETFLMRLIAGSDFFDLTGIPAKRGEVLRPMLGFLPNEIDAFVNQWGVSFREDSSNHSLDYQRNRIRHLCVEPMQKSDPKTIEYLAGMADFYARFQGVLERQLMREMRHWKPVPGGYLIEEGALNFPDALMRYFARSYGFSWQDIKQLTSGQKGRKLVSAHWELSRETQGFSLMKVQCQSFIQGVEIDLDQSGPFKIELKIGAPDWAKIGKNQFVLPLRCSAFPMRLRPWSAGDRFFPFGMKGSKLVSDFLTDEKLPHYLRSRVQVLCVGDEIAWVVGMRSDNRFRIVKGDEKYYLFSLKKMGHE